MLPACLFLDLAVRCYTCYTSIMKTVTVRDVRHNWPEVEASLGNVKEIVITKHSKPIAKIVQYVEKEKKRERFDFEEHRKWLEEINGDEELESFDVQLQKDREGRDFNDFK